jgi:probable HAF family extracellular repeat protein
MNDLGTLGGTNSVALGVNEMGQVVGQSGVVGNTTFHAFLHSIGIMTDLGTLGGSYSLANGINDLGQVVGGAQTSSGPMHAFDYANGTMRDLGTLGGSSSQALSINNQGESVGSAQTIDGATHAFHYNNGIMSDLGTLGGTHSLALRINDLGEIVGQAQVVSGAYQAFLYKNGNMSSLGTLGGTNSNAADINGEGHVVGGSQIVGDTIYHAYLYRGGALIDLNNFLEPGSEWELTQANGINDHGQIVGYGWYRGEIRAYLLTPSHQPVCSNAQAFPDVLWSPMHQFVPVVVMGVTDPDGDAMTITVTDVTQDEPVNGKGDGNTGPDAMIQAGAASVRAERSRTGNGRVYQISFRAEDNKGGSCTGEVTVGVPHSMKGGMTAIDDGQNYDSTDRNGGHSRRRHQHRGRDDRD